MSLKDTRVSAWEVFSVEIASGASLTDSINLGGLRLFGIVMPQEWTTANLTFQMSADAGATWANMLDQNGNEVLAVGEPERYVAIDKTAHFAPLQYVRVRSGTAVVPVAQTGTRVLKLVLRSV